MKGMKSVRKFLNKVPWKKVGLVLLMIIPVALYVIKFGGYKISDDPQDWGVFGDYIGGVYTVLVTLFAIYLTRNLEKRDAERAKAKAAVSAIYEQLAKINYQHVDLSSADKLLRLTKENELYLPQYLIEKLIELHDDYVEAKDEPNKFNLQNEL